MHASASVISCSHSSSCSAGRALSEGKLPTIPAVHWAMTSFGFDTMNIGAAIDRDAQALKDRRQAHEAVIFAVPGDEAWHAFVDRSCRCKARSRSIALMSAKVSFTSPGCIGLRIEKRFPARRFLEQLDDAHQVLATAVADIVDRMRRVASARFDRSVVLRRSIEAGDDPAYDVVDVSEVTPHLAAIVQRERLTREQRLGEDPHRHVRTAPRAIDGEEAQAGRRQAIEARVGFAQQLIRLLGRGVHRQRMIDSVFDPKREALVAPVDGGGGGIDEVPDLGVPRQLEHVAVPDEIGLNVSFRVLDAIPDARLGSEVNDGVEAVRVGQSLQRLSIREIHSLELETIAVLVLKVVEARLLQ